jgi:hypothetical protein
MVQKQNPVHYGKGFKIILKVMKVFALKVPLLWRDLG